MSVAHAGAFLTATKSDTFVFNKTAREMLDYYRPTAQALIASIVSDGRAAWLRPVVDPREPHAIPIMRYEYAPRRFPGRVRTQFRYFGFRDGIGNVHGRLPVVWDHQRGAFWATVPLQLAMMVPLHTVPVGPSTKAPEYHPLPPTARKRVLPLTYHPWSVHQPLLTKDGRSYLLNIAAIHMLRRYAPRTTPLLPSWGPHTLWLQPVCNPQDDHEKTYACRLLWSHPDGASRDEQHPWRGCRSVTFNAATLTHAIRLPKRSQIVWDAQHRAFRIDLAKNQTPRFACPSPMFASERVGWAWRLPPSRSAAPLAAGIPCVGSCCRAP